MACCGTDETISRLVAQYSDMLLRIACTRLSCPADAEDAVQEVFLKLLDSRPVFRDAGHEKAWLIRATLHRASDIRRRAERGNLPLDDALQLGAPPEDEHAALRAAVRALPEKYSAPIHLHYYEGYSIREIAKLLGVPAGTVGVRLQRGRERLKRALKEDV